MDPLSSAAASLAKSDNMGTLRARLDKLTADEPEQAKVLLIAARDHGLNTNTSFVHGLLARHIDGSDAAGVCALLALGSNRESLKGADWKEREINFHGPFRGISSLVSALGAEGIALLSVAESLEPFMRCAVEITLAADGLIAKEAISGGARADFLDLLVTFNFYDLFVSMGEAIWGEALLMELAAHIPSLPWTWLCGQERFSAIWEQLPPIAAAEILCRGRWDDLPTAVALLERFPGDLRAELIACAERWLVRYGDTASNLGGLGNLVNALGLARSGGVDEKYWRLLNTVTHRPEDVPFIHEAYSALPAEELEARALRHPGGVDMVIAALAPTEPVIGRLIAQILGWKKNQGDHQLRAVSRIFDAWGEAAAPQLVAALDGSRAPFTGALISALAANRLPETAEVFVRYLDHKQTRSDAAAALASLGGEAALAALGGALASRKRALRLGAAEALGRLPASKARSALASAHLARERVADVAALLERLVASETSA